MSFFVDAVIKIINPSDAHKSKYHDYITFFECLMKKSSDEIIILVTRRAHVLYKIFRSAIKNSNGINDCPSNVISSDAICCIKYLYDDYKNNKYSIVDDVIINGRRIKEVKGELLSLNIPNENITVRCMEYEDPPICLLPEEVNEIVPNNPVTERIWRNDSTQLTKLIYESCIGYDSLIVSYSIQIDSSLVAKLLRDLKTINNGLLFFANDINLEKENDSPVKSYFFKLIPGIRESNRANAKEIVSIIRMYYNSETNLFTILPYIFTDDILMDDCLSYCNIILNQYGKQIDLTSNQIYNDKDCLLLIYKRFIAQLSEILFSEFCNLYLIPLGLNMNMFEKNIQTESFPLEEFGSSFYCIHDCDKSDKLTLHRMHKHFNKHVQSTEENGYQIILKEFDDVLNATMKHIPPENNIDCIRKVLGEYFSRIKNIDDERAKNKQERCIGIRISDIFQESKQLSENKEMLYFILLAELDNGNAAYCYRVAKNVKGQDMICGFIRNGEQIFKEKYLLFYNEYYFLRLLYDICGEFRKNKVVKFAKYMSTATNNSNFVRLLNLINFDEDKYYSDLITVPLSFESYTPNDIELKAFKDYLELGY